MAGRINQLKQLPNFLLAAALTVATGFVFGEEAQSASSADPTRPPAAMLEPSSSNPTEATNGLQTVIVRKRGAARSLAVINGQTVELGGKVGDARVVRIDESQVELQGPGGKEVMRLTPAVDIKP
jgi:MSHA biogenesis protein MshK